MRLSPLVSWHMQCIQKVVSVIHPVVYSPISPQVCVQGDERRGLSSPCISCRKRRQPRAMGVVRSQQEGTWFSR
jgi:hypothetical protein